MNVRRAGRSGGEHPVLTARDGARPCVAPECALLDVAFWGGTGVSGRRAGAPWAGHAARTRAACCGWTGGNEMRRRMGILFLTCAWSLAALSLEAAPVGAPVVPASPTVDPNTELKREEAM